MERKINDVKKKVVESFSFTEGQLNAIRHKIPMTQEIFDSIIERCAVIGTSADCLLYHLLEEYPNLMLTSAEKIMEEVECTVLPPVSKDLLEQITQNVYERINFEYGDDLQ